MSYYILLCFIFSFIKAQTVNITSPPSFIDKRTHGKADYRSLFQDNTQWKPGDIPLLNRKVCQIPAFKPIITQLCISNTIKLINKRSL